MPQIEPLVDQPDIDYPSLLSESAASADKDVFVIGINVTYITANIKTCFVIFKVFVIGIGLIVVILRTQRFKTKAVSRAAEHRADNRSTHQARIVYSFLVLAIAFAYLGVLAIQIMYELPFRQFVWCKTKWTLYYLSSVNLVLSALYFSILKNLSDPGFKTFLVRYFRLCLEQQVSSSSDSEDEEHQLASITPTMMDSCPLSFKGSTDI